MLNGVSFHALPGIPEVRYGDDLGKLIQHSLDQAGLKLDATSVLVIAQKIVSKAEGRLVRLDSVTPSARALELAQITHKDPHLIELILSESSDVLRAVPGVMIVRHHLGLVMANAGIDQSNLPDNTSGQHALLLPLDPDASAARISQQLSAPCGNHPGVIISDSFGRPWRNGTVNIAIGAAGLPALIDQRNSPDRHGRTLQNTLIAYADAVASGAGLVMGESGEGTPVALVSGLQPNAPHTDAKALIRPLESDLFK